MTPEEDYLTWISLFVAVIEPGGDYEEYLAEFERLIVGYVRTASVPEWMEDHEQAFLDESIPNVLNALQELHGLEGDQLQCLIRWLLLIYRTLSAGVILGTPKCKEIIKSTVNVPHSLWSESPEVINHIATGIFAAPFSPEDPLAGELDAPLDSTIIPFYMSLLLHLPPGFLSGILRRFPTLSVEDPDENGYTPMLIAVHRNRADLVEELVRLGANVNARLTLGDSASLLDVAASQGKAAMVQLLVKLGADVNARDGSGSTPLLKAVLLENTQTIRELLRLGASPWLADVDGVSPSSAAMGSQSRTIVQLFDAFTSA